MCSHCDLINYSFNNQCIACFRNTRKHVIHRMAIITNKELAVYGWLRYAYILANSNTDYKDIINIIILYCAQGYAKYFDQNSNENDMRFGDIIKSEQEIDSAVYGKRVVRKYMVLDINGVLQYAGSIAGGTYENEYICIDIPISITQHLENAVEFYSKFDEDKEHFNWFTDYKGDKQIAETGRYLALKHDDQFIMQHFGGPLSSKYISEIRYMFPDKAERWEEERLDIFEGTSKSRHTFKPWQNEISYKDVNRYFENRNDTAKLIIIRVKCADIHNYDRPKDCRAAVSNIWTRRFNRHTRGLDYIGPKEEKDEMFLHLKEFYKNDPIAGEISMIDEYDLVDHPQFIYVLDAIKQA